MELEQLFDPEAPDPMRQCTECGVLLRASLEETHPEICTSETPTFVEVEA